ncbi:hypothetical protein [Streptomyces sp. NPDC048385]|uniref:hypothetical protein n=1 Tax=unclassified Streptomyces TaxID=2593676 RepID=UPI00343E7595
MTIRRPWPTWPAECAKVVVGAVVAAALILGLGWGRHGGWRLIGSAAAGLAVATAMSELPAPRSHEAADPGGSGSADSG